MTFTGVSAHCDRLQGLWGGLWQNRIEGLTKGPNVFTLNNPILQVFCIFRSDGCRPFETLISLWKGSVFKGIEFCGSWVFVQLCWVSPFNVHGNLVMGGPSTHLEQDFIKHQLSRGRISHLTQTNWSFGPFQLWHPTDRIFAVPACLLLSAPPLFLCTTWRHSLGVENCGQVLVPRCLVRWGFVLEARLRGSWNKAKTSLIAECETVNPSGHAKQRLYLCLDASLTHMCTFAWIVTSAWKQNPGSLKFESMKKLCTAASQVPCESNNQSLALLLSNLRILHSTTLAGNLKTIVHISRPIPDRFFFLPFWRLTSKPNEATRFHCFCMPRSNSDKATQDYKFALFTKHADVDVDAVENSELFEVHLEAVGERADVRHRLALHSASGKQLQLGCSWKDLGSFCAGKLEKRHVWQVLLTIKFYLKHVYEARQLWNRFSSGRTPKASWIALKSFVYNLDLHNFILE